MREIKIGGKILKWRILDVVGRGIIGNLIGILLWVI